MLRKKCVEEFCRGEWKMKLLENSFSQSFRTHEIEMCLRETLSFAVGVFSPSLSIALSCESATFSLFSQSSKDVLECFESYKLEDIKSSKKHTEKHKGKAQHNFFAKYLTSDKVSVSCVFEWIKLRFPKSSGLNIPVSQDQTTTVLFFRRRCVVLKFQDQRTTK